MTVVRNASLNNERPFRSRRVPMKFAHRAWLEAHRNSGDALGNRQLLYCGLFTETIADDFAFGFLEGKLKGG
jgi:hypothetical protein